MGITSSKRLSNDELGVFQIVLRSRFLPINTRRYAASVLHQNGITVSAGENGVQIWPLPPGVKVADLTTEEITDMYIVVASDRRVSERIRRLAVAHLQSLGYKVAVSDSGETIWGDPNE